MNIDELIEIPDFTGYYVSKEGKIYSTLKKGCRNRYDLSKRTKPTEMSYRLTKKGYARVYMRRESTNTREDVYIHRIVAMTFIENPYNYKEVNHIDNNRSNNNVNNLEWCSREQNLQHAMEYGNMTRDELGRFTHK